MFHFGDSPASVENYSLALKVYLYYASTCKNSGDKVPVLRLNIHDNICMQKGLMVGLQ